MKLDHKPRAICLCLAIHKLTFKPVLSISFKYGHLNLLASYMLSPYT